MTRDAAGEWAAVALVAVVLVALGMSRQWVLVGPLLALLPVAVLLRGRFTTKLTLLVAKNWHAKDLFGPFAKVVGGGGGGSPTLASGGGKDATKLEEAFEVARKIVLEKAK